MRPCVHDTIQAARPVRENLPRDGVGKPCENRVVAIGPYELTATELSASISADRLGLPYLLFRGDDGELVIRTLEDQVLVVGRSPDADLPLVWDGEVSRVHAQLERIAGRWTVSDDGLAVTFTLRRNVAFHRTDYFKPTRPLNADDVLFTFQRMLDKNHPFRKAYPTEFPYFTDMGLDKNIATGGTGDRRIRQMP